jgi:transcriptional regulator with XRE-family HTH domain
MLIVGDLMIDEKVIEGLREYLKDHYTPPINIVRSLAAVSLIKADTVTRKARTLRSISDEATEYIEKHRKPGGFGHALDRKREEKGLKPAELYKRANIDRRQYSRYLGPEGRHPSKNTVISFALALRLERPEFDEFLQTAGYSLSNESSRDVCIMYCLEKGIYDISEVNALLFAIGIEPLSRDNGA